ncbi:MAG: hypothetical protein HKN52_10405 [Eudoraea sp.]|nr:hypothetical protein [Eudoraea sp.]
MKIISTTLMFFACVLVATGQDRDCLLGLGGTASETIIQVFQLNKEQISKMDQWKASLSQENKIIQDEITQLFDAEGQSSEEELQAMATTYRGLKDKVIENSKAYDRKLLNIFNEKQYLRYVALCKEARRKPIAILSPSQGSKDPE